MSDSAALAAFVRARLNEEERAAHRSADFGGGIIGIHWRISGTYADEGGTYWRVTAAARAESHEQTIEVVGGGMSGGGAHTEPVAAHVVRQDPAHTLRRITAARELLSRYEAMQADVLVVMGVEAILSEYQRVILPQLALPYADHPDYQQKWRL